MDGDNDLDLLYTNGDSFDRGVKPHHSIQWLENRGEFPYTHHHIAAMPGVQIGRSGDVDGDGDMDVIAASLIVGGTAADFQSPENASVVLFRQNDDGSFTPSMVESAVPRHLTVLLTDIDVDGRIDLVVGNFMRGGPVDAPDLKVFLNSSGKR